jgi:hypothetical protein
MSRKIIKYIGVFILLLLTGGIINAKPCLAASAKIEISSDSTEVTVGDKFFVYVTVSSDELIGDVEANLTYDDDIMEYTKGVSAITGSSGFLRIAEIDVAEGTDNRKYTLEFEALEVGFCDISVSGKSRVSEFEKGLEMSVSSDILSINVKAAETASENALLESLKINPSVLTPVFDKNTFAYSANVGYEVNKLIIDALPEDSKATVSIDGNEFLKEGENKVIITVLAESGAVIEYTVTVIKEEAPISEVPEETETEPEIKNNSFEVALINGEKFAIYEGNYKLLEPGSEVVIPKGYEKDGIIVSDIAIDVYLPIEDKDSDFVLIYAENELGEAGFYQYDKIERTLQRYIPKEAGGFDTSVNPENDELKKMEEYRSNLSKAAFVIALLSVICVALIAVLIRIYMKSRGFGKDDLN